MSTEQITDLDKRLSMLEATTIRVLEAVEKQANSTSELNKSVTKMTTSFDHLRDDMKQMRAEVDECFKLARSNATNIAVMQNSGKSIDYVKRAIVGAVVAGVFAAIYAAKQ